ncbi:MAG: hypothetical protein Q4F95_07340 [Oscillospiraceae bacterium]|nr:hypothetical protein [Oscillospiraceae bacterium]
MKKYNNFHCLTQNAGKCNKYSKGNIACVTCGINRKCKVCGRKGTSSCDSCENKKEDEKT